MVRSDKKMTAEIFYQRRAALGRQPFNRDNSLLAFGDHALARVGNKKAGHHRPGGPGHHQLGLGEHGIDGQVLAGSGALVFEGELLERRRR